MSRVRMAYDVAETPYIVLDIRACPKLPRVTTPHHGPF